MVNKFFYWLLCFGSNNRFVSHAIQKFARSRWSRWTIASYCRLFQITESQAGYASLHAFFTRPKADLDERLATVTNQDVISPVDGRLMAVTTTSDCDRLTIKGQSYTLASLVGDLPASSTGYHVLLFYLSPANYHRFHAPVADHYRYVGAFGKYSYPVNDLGLRYTSDLYAKNYRHVYQIASQNYFIAVGAMNINSITSHVSTAMTATAIGDELGYFSFGSSVVLLLSQADYQLNADLVVEQAVSVGDQLGERINGN